MIRVAFIFLSLLFVVWPLQAKHAVSLTTDYFDKNFDVVNYIDNIDTSSIPEQLTRLKVQYDYDLGSINVGISGGTEKGRITRQSEPYKVSNQFKQYSLHIGQRSQNKRHRTQLDIGHIQQKNITLDCVQRSGVLLGGNCLDADFRLLDGDIFAQTGERTYLPVLSSEASADFAKLNYYYYLKFYSLYVSLNGQLSYFDIQHDTQSPLFALSSDFLLDTVYNGKTLRSVINDIQNELPQQTPWQDLILSFSAEAFYPIGPGKLHTKVGVLRSEKRNYLQEQRYKYNLYLGLGYEVILHNNLSVKLYGTAYRYYLQGIQPILYTPKTAKFFAHPYGEISLSFHYTF